MHILISNDDGIFALGIRTLANTIASHGYKVTVVAPDRERSATGHGLTLHHPIRADIIEGIFTSEVTAWSCSGTPSDCVKLGLSAVLKEKPDFVLSGINQGSNLGTDILYSGTVSAAMEGTIDGITSIAFSLASFTKKEFQPAANYAIKLIEQLIKNPLPEPTLLNINIPPVAEADIAGVKITRQGIRRYIENFQKRFDPRGKCYYWLAGELVEEINQPEHIYLPPDLPTDVQANKENFITITPLQYNLTDVVTVKRLQNQNFEG
ncbi:5'/3'-nucleotidase SurE [Geminocystis sp. GBBB08]|uniref:5'/3'-nucleotidase SurE n=1 Tax=Geminocystis sp. GBBB08 TaxID=2604140 RepID=UPI0027E27DBB|nr:5'/3'-nucleotidase SurE [Geminocystis sp. GBBB08]MBL1210909.1 5'/3'-nucleotidase SurE [Geminocystis sp. GBBB08]